MALTTINGKIAEIKTGSWGVGLKIHERISAGDKDFDRQWMCWIKDPAATYTEGEVVTITGELDVKHARDYKTKQLRGYTDQTTGQLVPYLDFTLNGCRVEPTGW